MNKWCLAACAIWLKNTVMLLMMIGLYTLTARAGIRGRQPIGSLQ